MTVSNGFRTVAEAIDALEEAGVDVQDAGGDDLITEDGVSVRLSGTLDLPDVDVEGIDVTPDAATLEDGTIRIDLTVTAACEDGTAGDEDPEAAPEDAASDDEGEATPPHRDPGRLREVYAEHDSFSAMTDALDVDVAPNTVRRNMIKHGIHDPEDEEAADGTPPHRDPERLRAVYEEHDSFAAMTEALGADVTPQTVRRQMIEHGIHDPDSTGEEPETALADGIDLPAGAGLDDLKAAVVSGRTVHEVGRALDVERERARRLLAELDLLELVTGRLAAEREIDPEEIDRRIAGASPREA